MTRGSVPLPFPSRRCISRSSCVGGRRGTGRVGNRAAEHSKLNVSRAGLGLRAEPPQQHLSNRGAGERDETQEAYDIRKNPRGDKKSAGNQDDDAVCKLLAGQLAGIETAIQTLPGGEAFPAGKVTPHHPRDDDKGNCGPETNELIDLNQDPKFDSGRQKKEQDKASEHR